MHKSRIKIMRNLSVWTFSILLIVFSISCSGTGGTQQNPPKETTYQKVLKTGKIRAAYTIYPPGCMKDSSGKLTGVFVETLEKAAELLDLKVEWTEEVGWATQIEGLETDRYDMIGSSAWANPKRAKLTTLTLALYYSPIYVYTRKDEPRFDNLQDLNSLNVETVRIATIDGGTGEQIAKNQFPKAQRIALPQLTDFSQSFLDVVGKKADIVLMEPFHANKFLASNPNSIKNVTEGKPLRTFGNSYMFNRDQPEFEHMLNVVLQDLINSGYVDELLSKYEQYPNSYLRTNRPYQVK